MARRTMISVSERMKMQDRRQAENETLREARQARAHASKVLPKSMKSENATPTVGPADLAAALIFAGRC